VSYIATTIMSDAAQSSLGWKPCLAIIGTVVIVVAAWFIIKAHLNRKKQQKKSERGSPISSGGIAPVAPSCEHGALRPVGACASVVTPLGEASTTVSGAIAVARNDEDKAKPAVKLDAVPVGGPLDHVGLVEQENLMHRYESPAASSALVAAYLSDGAMAQ
jgi:hypothetical protein